MIAKPSAPALVLSLLLVGCSGAAPTADAPRPSPAGSGPGQAAGRGAPTAGVGAPGTSAQAASPRAPRPSPSGPAAVRLTEEDAGKTVRVRVGQLLRVRLQGAAWQVPSSSADNVVTLSSSKGGGPDSNKLRAEFTARAAGTARLTSRTQAEPAQQWSVTVQVS